MARYEALGPLTADGEAIAAALTDEAMTMVAEATEDHGRMAEAGLALLPATDGRPLRILTHCNTGPLAAGQYGTALGVVQAAHHAERPLHVWVDETRPYLQGARLTTWELDQAGVPHTLIPDMAAGPLMARGEVDVVLVGGDRVAANGDTANKLGTYTLAVLAARHGVPFIVAAPLSSVDLEMSDGSAIPIEERPAEEVTTIRGVRIAPAGTAVHNPSFDITPGGLIDAIVTEEGAVRAPYGPGLRAAMDRREARRREAARTAAAPAGVT
jgi:methylthioribose-1-phosphate isomerase